ncbi:MAG: DUF2087 domain-containing protein [Oscillospiraceae bacterium]
MGIDELGSKERMKAIEKEIDSPENAWQPDEDTELEVTDEEREKILTAVLVSREPLRLKIYPAKLKKKLVVLRLLSDSFECGRTYTQKEVNEILTDVWQDPVALRRDLIDMGWLSRTQDGAVYWKN